MIRDIAWLEAKIEKIPEAGCWIWMGATRAFGHGVISNRPRPGNTYIHRLAWRLYRGHLPNELDVLHRCDVPQCVNPEHLFLGTKRDNALDMWRKGRGNTSLNTAKGWEKRRLAQ
jgi:hypothetical protein